MKYLVMETHPAYAVVLDQEGRFLKAANLRYQVGDTVEHIVELRQPRRKVLPFAPGRLRPLAAMAACLALVLTALFWMGQLPHASVYLSINPSVRIDVDRRDRVVALEGLNEDGETLIDGYGYRRKALDLVVDELIDRSIALGFLHQGGQITLELDARSQQWVEAHTDSLRDHLGTYLEEKLTVDIQIVGADTPRSETVVIPVPPAQSGGEGASGDDEGASDYEEGASDYKDAASDYEGAVSDYDDAPAWDDEDDGQTDYGPAPEPPDDDAPAVSDDSGYDPPDPQSDYGDNSDDDDDADDNDDEDG